MSFVYETPREPFKSTFADGEATLGSIFDAATDAAVLVGNTNARKVAQERVWAEHLDKVRAATGYSVDQFNDLPATDPRLGATPQEKRQVLTFEQQSAMIKERLRELANRNPRHAGVINPDIDFEAKARELAFGAEQKLGELSASRGGFGGAVAGFAGAAVGALRDPIQVATLFAGGGGGAVAKTVAGKVLGAATREAVVNSGAEALLQPAVQNWRKELGLEYGVVDAARNVAFAGLLGGAFGAAGKGLQVAGAYVFKGKQLDAIAAEVADKSPDLAKFADDFPVQSPAIAAEARIAEAVRIDDAPLTVRDQLSITAANDGARSSGADVVSRPLSDELTYSQELARLAPNIQTRFDEVQETLAKFRDERALAVDDVRTNANVIERAIRADELREKISKSGSDTAEIGELRALAVSKADSDLAETLMQRVDVADRKIETAQKRLDGLDDEMGKAVTKARKSYKKRRRTESTRQLWNALHGKPVDAPVLAERLQTVRDHLPAEARGALDAMEAEALFSDVPPQALRAAEAPSMEAYAELRAALGEPDLPSDPPMRPAVADDIAEPVAAEASPHVAVYDSTLANYGDDDLLPGDDGLVRVADLRRDIEQRELFSDLIESCKVA